MKKMTSGSEFFPLRAVLYGMGKSHLPHKMTSLECYLFFILHVHNCVMGATPTLTLCMLDIPCTRTISEDPDAMQQNATLHQGHHFC